MQLTTSCAVICLIHALTCMSGHASIKRGKPYPGFLTQRQRYDQHERFAREGDSEESTSSEETDSSEGSDSSEDTVPRCPDRWLPYGKSCYFEGITYKTWDSARPSCQTRDSTSDLVTINSQAERDFLATLPTLGEQTIWTGLTDSNMEGSFVWISSGSSPSFTDWANMQPSSYDPLYDCVLNDNAGSGWFTSNCDYAYEYVCERPA